MHQLCCTKSANKELAYFLCLLFLLLLNQYARYVKEQLPQETTDIVIKNDETY
jgi:hypothetical protein